MPRKNKIIIRTGTGAPTASDFVTGEPAFDSTAGALYVKNAAGTMAQIAGGGGTTIADEFVYDCGEYTAASSSSSSSSAIAASLLTIARNNGTSTFTGLGTTASPFVRAAGFSWDEANGLSRYSWTANGSATVTVTFYFSDDTGDGFCSRVVKNSTRITPDNCGGTATRTFSVVSGDVITIGVDVANSMYFDNVSVSAA